MIRPTGDHPAEHLRLRALAKRLDDLQRRFDSAHDSRAVFTFVYKLLIRELDQRLDTMGLLDPTWLIALAEAFANRYFAAVQAFDGGQPVSRAWQRVFENTVSRRSSVLEDTVFPLVAHIVHDLPLALHDVEFDALNVHSRLHDYDKVNDVVGESIAKFRRQVTCRYSRWLRFIDRMERHYDLILNDYGIRISRSQAWYDALRLRDRRLRKATRCSLESRPQELVNNVQKPRDLWVGGLLGALRGLAALLRRWPSPEAGASSTRQ